MLDGGDSRFDCRAGSAFSLHVGRHFHSGTRGLIDDETNIIGGIGILVAIDVKQGRRFI